MTTEELKQEQKEMKKRWAGAEYKELHSKLPKDFKEGMDVTAYVIAKLNEGAK